MSVAALPPQHVATPTPSNDVFRGRVAIITGASRGIGRQIALDFASKGAKGMRLRHLNFTFHRLPLTSDFPNYSGSDRKERDGDSQSSWHDLLRCERDPRTWWRGFGILLTLSARFISFSYADSTRLFDSPSLVMLEKQKTLKRWYKR